MSTGTCSFQCAQGCVEAAIIRIPNSRAVSATAWRSSSSSVRASPMVLQTPVPISTWLCRNSCVTLPAQPLLAARHELRRLRAGQRARLRIDQQIFLLDPDRELRSVASHSCPPAVAGRLADPARLSSGSPPALDRPAPHPLAVARGGRTIMQPLGIGIVGLGMVADVHARALHELADTVTVRGVYSRDPARRRGLRRTPRLPRRRLRRGAPRRPRDRGAPRPHPARRPARDRRGRRPRRQARPDGKADRTGRRRRDRARGDLRAGRRHPRRRLPAPHARGRPRASPPSPRRASSARSPRCRPPSPGGGRRPTTTSPAAAPTPATAAACSSRRPSTPSTSCSRVTGPVAEVAAIAGTTSLHRMEAEDFVGAGLRFANGALGVAHRHHRRLPRRPRSPSPSPSREGPPAWKAAR